MVVLLRRTFGQIKCFLFNKKYTMFSATETQIILSTGVIGALLVLLCSQLCDAADSALPPATPVVVRQVVGLAKQHSAAPLASFLLVTAIVSVALLSRSRLEPLFAQVRRTLG